MQFAIFTLQFSISIVVAAQQNPPQRHATIQVDLPHPPSNTAARLGRRARKENRSSPADNPLTEFQGFPTGRHASKVRPARQRSARPAPCRHHHSRRPGPHVSLLSDEKSIVDETSESP